MGVWWGGWGGGEAVTKLAGDGNEGADRAVTRRPPIVARDEDGVGDGGREE